MTIRCSEICEQQGNEHQKGESVKAEKQEHHALLKWLIVSSECLFRFDASGSVHI